AGADVPEIGDRGRIAGRTVRTVGVRLGAMPGTTFRRAFTGPPPTPAHRTPTPVPRCTRAGAWHANARTSRDTRCGMPPAPGTAQPRHVPAAQPMDWPGATWRNAFRLAS